MTFNCKTELVMDCGEGTSSGLTAHQLFRQSFDRFDDNLAENILSYLTFSEKVLFESVSKQWKKCVYNQQKQLSLTRWEDDDNDSLNKLLEPIEVIDYNSATAVANGLKRVNKFWLKSVIKKCKSIERVVLDLFVDLEDVDIICRNCPKLKSIEFDTSGMCADDLDHMGNRYGHLFERVNFMYSFVAPKYWNKLLTHCKNLRQLFAQNINELLVENREYLPKLEIIDNYQLYSGGDEQDNENIWQKFNEICDKYSESLQKLTVSISCETKVKELESTFNSICKLTKLKSISYHSSNVVAADEDIEKYLTQMSQNLHELQRMNLSLYSSNQLKIDNIFNAFKGFRTLLDLDLYIYGYNEKTTVEGSVECLKSSQNLKFLSITIEAITEEFFADIDKHLPNLMRLTIGCESEITDKTILQLSHLKKLKAFNLNKFQKPNKCITDESVCAVIKGCPDLETLCFSTRPNITNKTIQTLINCANNNPKRSLYFESGLSDGEEGEEQIPAIDMITFAEQIPENLTINYAINNNNEE